MRPVCGWPTMSHARTASSSVRAVEHQLSEVVAVTSYSDIARLLGLASHAQVSRRLAVAATGMAYIEVFSAIDLVWLCRANPALKTAVIEAVCGVERQADGERVTADMRALLTAVTSLSAAEAQALEDGRVEDAELREVLRLLPALRERLDRFEADALTRLAARKAGAA